MVEYGPKLNLGGRKRTAASEKERLDKLPKKLLSETEPVSPIALLAATTLKIPAVAKHRAVVTKKLAPFAE